MILGKGQSQNVIDLMMIDLVQLLKLRSNAFEIIPVTALHLRSGLYGIYRWDTKDFLLGEKVRKEAPRKGGLGSTERYPTQGGLRTSPSEEKSLKN